MNLNLNLEIIDPRKNWEDGLFDPYYEEENEELC